MRDKRIPTDEQVDNIIRTLYTMYAEKLGVSIEITKEEKGVNLNENKMEKCI